MGRNVSTFTEEREKKKERRELRKREMRPKNLNATVTKHSFIAESSLKR